MNPKTLNEVVVGETVLRFIGGLRTPMLLQVTGVTEDQIVCGEWHFDKRTGAEIDEDLGWSPALTGSYILPVGSQLENN